MLAALLVAVGVMPSQAAERLTDQQVKSLIESVDKGFDKWKDGLEKANMDDAVIKSAAGTIDVRQFLKGFKDDISKLKDKFKPENAAVAEATQLLRKGSDVERRYKQRGGAAGSEWAALSNNLGALAAAYGGPWPIETLDVAFTRVNDKDLAGRLESLERSAKTLGSEMDKAASKDKAFPKADRDKLKADAKLLESTAKELRSRIKDGKPASAEAKSLVQQIGGLQPRVSAMQALATPGKTAWDQVIKGGQAVALAFGEPMPR
jgi:gas vesicle protein